jgi:hypothetical protein
MKPALFFLAAACLAATSGLAAASETGAAPKTDPVNAFAAPLMVHGEQKSPPSNEDSGSPYVEAHQFEEHLYLDRYFFHHGAKPDNPNAPLPEEPTTPVDADGRPLWFDTGWGDEILNTLVARLVAHKQFDDVDRLFAEWNNSAERMADGRWKLLAFYDEYNVWLNNPQDWDTTYQFIADWRKQKPGSAAWGLA